MLDKQKEIERRREIFHKYLLSSEYFKKVAVRININKEAAQSDIGKKVALAACAKSPIFFIENFLMTFDPRPEHRLTDDTHDIPFLLFDFQENMVKWFLDHIDNGKDGLGEKSRDMGFTWIMLAVLLWYWRFKPGFNALVGSYKEALVDNRTKDSLFGMLDYMLSQMPDWMLPEGFRWDKHRNKLKLINPENNNLITGDTMNPNFGRGARKSVVVLDEGASWEYFKDAWDSAGDTTSCRLTFSTPKGQNAFWMLRESGIDILTIHWKLHPLKDDIWYEFECDRRTDEEIAQELDISYQKSQQNRVYPEWDNVHTGVFPYTSDRSLYVAWDFGQTDDTAIIWLQKMDIGRCVVVDCYWNHGKDINFYIPFITGVVPPTVYGYSERDMKIIEEHRMWTPGTHFGDPSGRFRNQMADKTVHEALKEAGIYVNFDKNWQGFEKRKNAARILMKDLLVNDNERTRYLSMCMSNAKYPAVKQGGVDQVKSAKPRHDYTSHLRSTFEYMALGVSDIVERSTSRVFDKFPKRTERANPFVGRGSRRSTGY